MGYFEWQDDIILRGIGMGWNDYKLWKTGGDITQ